jgi:hypothetical protein
MLKVVREYMPTGRRNVGRPRKNGETSSDKYGTRVDRIYFVLIVLLFCCFVVAAAYGDDDDDDYDDTVKRHTTLVKINCLMFCFAVGLLYFVLSTC